MSSLLSLKNVNVYYDSIHAVKNLNFEVNSGEIVCLIGANGAGKTTIMQCISGLLRAKSGEIFYQEKDIQKLSADQILKAGLAQVPEGRRVFTELTVRENLEIGAYSRQDKKEIEADIAKYFKRFPRLKEREMQLAGTLSGGEQQMLAIARALMARPKLLLLDEPSMGLAPILVQDIFRIIRDVRDLGTTVLLVEQNAQMALCLADRAYVLETGEIKMQGKAHELLGNPKIQAAYLGAS